MSIVVYELRSASSAQLAIMMTHNIRGTDRVKYQTDALSKTLWIIRPRKTV
jgi:hypothetical protein